MLTTPAVSPSKNGSTQKNVDAPLTQVYQTREYDKFRNLHGNRVVNLAHVKRLTASISERHLVCPIIVNERFEIIDGQHRFMVCKELELPIYYIIIKNYGLNEVQIFNSNSSIWNKRDYLESYCQLGLRPYLEFKRFAAMFPEFPITVCGMLLSGRAKINGVSKQGSFPRKEFEEGNFAIQDFEKAVKYGRRIMDFMPHYKGFAKPIFVRTLIIMFGNKDYNHDIMIKKLKVAGNMKLSDQSSAKNYLLLLEDIFNYKNSKKVNLRIHG